MKKIVLLAALFALIPTVWLLARPFMWIRDYRAVVTCDGRELQHPRVFESSRGEVWAIPGGTYNRGSYVIYPARHSVGTRPGTAVILETSILVIFKEAAVLCVNLEATGKLSSRHTPDLQLKEREAEFFDPDGHLIRVTW